MAGKQGLDVYKQWLGIADENRPLTYYQLLKLKPFEDNSVLIRKQYRMLNAHVRKFASGEYLEESQQLLNELAKAMLCLTDADRKAEYDASLGRREESTRVRKTFEDILLFFAFFICTPDQMKKAKNYADAVGLELYQAALQHKLGAPEIIMLAYAESIGLPFINLDDVGVDEEFVPQISPVMARQHSLIPVMVDQGKLIFASPRLISPDIEEELRMLFEMPVRPALCVPNQINEAVAKYYPKDAVQMVAQRGGGQKAVSSQTSSKLTSKPARVAEPREPVSHEEMVKKRTQGTIIGFNCGVIAGVLGATQVLKFGLMISIGIGVGVGAAAAGIAFVMLSKR